MNASTRTVLSKAVAGTANLADLTTLCEAGATPRALTNRKAEMAILAEGRMLSDVQIANLAADGVDVKRFVGVSAPAIVASLPPSVPSVAVPAAPANTGNVEHVEGVTPIPNGGRIISLVDTVNDPFGFLTQMPATATALEKKARRSLYNSFTSRTQSKVVEGYRNFLKDGGREIDKDTMSESMKAARSAIGLDRLLDGVMAKKGFKVDRAKQNVDLVDALRFHLDLNGFTVSADLHAEALAAGVAHASAFADRASAGLKSRTLTMA